MIMMRDDKKSLRPGSHPQMHPHVATELPGPRAKAIIAMDESCTSPSYIKEYPLVADRGQGCFIDDVDGNRFLDMMAGIAVSATGYAHPHVVGAVKEALDKVWHICGTDFYTDSFSRLCSKLAGYVPGMGKKRVFLTNSGTEAIEGAMKLARFHTKRKGFLSFYGGFHGRTLGALSLTASKVRQRENFGPFIPGVVHAEYPDVLRRPAGMTPEECGVEAIRKIERQLFGRVTSPDELAAIFVEPIQGEGGYVVPPKSFLKGLRDLCDRHGILLVFDEVQSGVGRTGEMYAAEYFDVAPDILLSAKGLGSGLPIGAIIARENIMTWTRGSHGSTFGGNNVSCAAAIATLEVVERMLPDIRKNGELLSAGLKKLAEKHPCIIDVRGPGFMIGMELARPGTRESVPGMMAELEQMAFREGLLLLGSGASTIRFAPPLVCGPHEISIAIDILDRCLGRLSAR
jgi:4-aminobutyrate aminotransferase